MISRCVFLYALYMDSKVREDKHFKAIIHKVISCAQQFDIIARNMHAYTRNTP